MSPKLYEVFDCFTDVRTKHAGIFEVVLVLESELMSDPVFWRHMNNKYHVAKLTSLDRALEAVEYYSKCEDVVNRPPVGMAAERLKFLKQQG
jgi:hypothetical protein